MLNTGPAYLEQWGSPSRSQLVRTLLANLLLLVILRTADATMSTDVALINLVAAYLVFYFVLYRPLFLVGRRRLWKYSNELCKGKRNEFVWSSLSTGSNASQPSALHHYALMIYDVSTDDVLVEGEVNWRDLKYWSIVPYDLEGLPMKQFFNDDNSKNFSGKEGSFRFRLRITASEPPRGAVSYASTAEQEQEEQEPYDTLYVDRDKASVAYLMFRIVHPTDPAQIHPVPRASIVKRGGSSSGGRSDKMKDK